MRSNFSMRWLTPALWLLFVLWLLTQAAYFIGLDARGLSPIDFLSYQRAAAALERGESPYLPRAQAQAIWRYFHQVEAELEATHARGEGQQMLREISARPQQPGPYQYPPSLALVVAELPVSPVGFAFFTLASILGFAWLWLKGARAHAVWLLLLPLSWDLAASTWGGNAEVALLFATLLAAWTLWNAYSLAAAPLIALILLIKPFYALFFIALVLLRYTGPAETPRPKFASLALLVLVMSALVAAEIARWGAPLRGAALDFFRHAWDSLWFALPPAEQTPMSAWNRTPLQVLVNAGVPVHLAQGLALGLWVLLLAITLWRVRRTSLGFPLAFAFALTLLYLGRPVGWGFIYLEFVAAVVIWPSLERWQRPIFIVCVLILFATRWWALALAMQGAGMPLLTLQTPRVPWETLVVLPAIWLLLLRAARRSAAQAVQGEGMLGRTQ